MPSVAFNIFLTICAIVVSPLLLYSLQNSVKMYVLEGIKNETSNYMLKRSEILNKSSVECPIIYQGKVIKNTAGLSDLHRKLEVELYDKDSVYYTTKEFFVNLSEEEYLNNKYCVYNEGNTQSDWYHGYKRYCNPDIIPVYSTCTSYGWHLPKYSITSNFYTDVSYELSNLSDRDIKHYENVAFLWILLVYLSRLMAFIVICQFIYNVYKFIRSPTNA